MTDQEIRDTVGEAIRAVAPEADVAGVPDGASLRDELDLDSMDMLNVAIGLHERLGVELGEEDYPELVTIAGCIALVRRKEAAA